MTRLTAGLLLPSVVLFLVGFAFAGQSQPLTNDDIKKMIAGGFSDDVIVSAIAANDTNFDVSVDGLTGLKAAGVSEKVLSAMLAATAHKRDNGAAAPAAAPANAAAGSPSLPASYETYRGAMPARIDPNMFQQLMSAYGMGNPLGMGGMTGARIDPSQMPAVTWLDASHRQPMRPSVSQVAHTQTKGGFGQPGAGMSAAHMLGGVGGEALSFASFAGPYGMMAGPALGMATSMLSGFGGHHGPPKIIKVWALPGHNSTVPITSRSPRFEVALGNLLGLDADSYEPYLVKLVQTKDNWRLVGATKTKMSVGMTMGAMDEEALAKVTEDRVPARADRVGPGLVQIQPSAPLTPGEYGLVLRPIHAGKRSKGSLGGPAEQNVFYSIWDFTVN